MMGKACAGPLSDLYGGKIVMFVSAVGFLILIPLFAYLPTLLEGFGIQRTRLCLGETCMKEKSYFPEFLAVWFLNGFFALGLAWVAVMAVASNWVPSTHTGRLMAILGLAPELGDSWARYYLAPVVHETGSWNAVLLAAAKFSVILVLPMFLFVSDHPPGGGGSAARGPGAGGTQNTHQQNRESFCTRLKQLMTRSPLILLLMTMCGFLYAIRTMFLLYSVNYLAHVICDKEIWSSDLGAFVYPDLARITTCIQDKV